MYIENTVKSIEPGAFSADINIENLYLPSSVTYIGDGAFSGCSVLKNIDFSEGLTTIAPIAFKYCLSLQSLSFPTTLTEIGDGAFYQCASLNKVIMNEGLTSIGEGAFTACPKLTQVIVPRSVSDIKDHAFGYDIKDDDYAKKDDFSMSVYAGSSAERYAKSNKIKYTALDKSVKQYAFIIISVGVLLAFIVIAVMIMRRGKKSASPEVKKADMLEQEKAEEENYEKILADDE
jgi:hypothetical protein